MAIESYQPPPLPPHGLPLVTRREPLQNFAEPPREKLLLGFDLFPLVSANPAQKTVAAFAQRSTLPQQARIALPKMAAESIEQEA